MSGQSLSKWTLSTVIVSGDPAKATVASGVRARPRRAEKAVRRTPLLALAAWPAGFPILASAFAGLVTMAACARLALARILASAAGAADPPSG